MGNLLTKTGRSISESDKAVLALKTQRRRLVAEQRRVEGVLEHERMISRQLVANGKSDRALAILRKKRLQQARLKDLDNWLLKVEQMLGDLEATNQTNDLVLALKQGQDTLQQLQQEVTLADVEQLMNKNAEAKAVQDEMHQMLGITLTSDEEEAVAAELSEMQALSAIDLMPNVPGHNLPHRPQHQATHSNGRPTGELAQDAIAQ